MRNFKDIASGLLLAGTLATGLVACATTQTGHSRTSLRGPKPDDCGYGIMKGSTRQSTRVCIEGEATMRTLDSLYAGNCGITSCDMATSDSAVSFNNYIQCSGAGIGNAEQSVLVNHADTNKDGWVTGNEARNLLFGYVRNTLREVCTQSDLTPEEHHQ
jgi:hypothetical protein